ncbi:MAG TPA: hypothetical protein PLS03_09135, partial [Terrimicrobiaceae bacterium]|nr:hypothetical protein [Terrimicrobiaceae bacterium]
MTEENTNLTETAEPARAKSRKPAPRRRTRKPKAASNGQDSLTPETPSAEATVQAEVLKPVKDGDNTAPASAPEPAVPAKAQAPVVQAPSEPPPPPAPPTYAEGIVEVSGKGFGFLREPRRNFSQSNNDVFVTPEVVRKYALR